MRMPDVDNLSIPMGGGAGERLPVWIRTRPSARVPDLDRNIAQSQAQMAIALWLITLAFGPASIRNRWFESSPLQRRVHQTSPATLQTRGVGSPREWVFVHKWLLERKRSYLTEKGLFSRKAVKGDATEPINFIKEESHGTRSTPHRHRT